MKIAVIGTGGVGGYLAAMLAYHLPQEDSVTVVARGARGKSIEENGLIMHSALHGEILARPKVALRTDALGDQDVIFLCVKNYSLENVLEELRGVVREGTILVTLLNGVDPGDRVRKAYPDNPVVDSVIYIVSYANPDYSIRHQSDFAKIRIGAKDAGARPEAAAAVETVAEVLQKAKVDCRVSRDIVEEIWKKFIVNCGFNVLTAAYDSNIGPLRADPERSAEFEALSREACAVARAQGAAIPDDYEQRVIDRFYHVYTDEDSSSLQRDVHAGRPAEVETFCGYIVRASQALGLEAPVMTKMYQRLRPDR